MDRRWVAGAVALALVGAGLSGCRQDDAAPVATSAVTASPTPTEDPLFTEAKRVHLAYLQQMVAFEESGGGNALPQKMNDLVDGEYQDALVNVYKKFHERGLRASPTSEWRRTAVWSIDPTSGHDLGLGACVDLRSVTYSKSGSDETSRGVLRRDELMFDRHGSSLVITEGSSRKVESCTAED